MISSSSPVFGLTDPRYLLKVKIRGVEVMGLIDTGATHSYLGESFASELKDALIPSNATVLIANNKTEQVAGEVNI